MGEQYLFLLSPIVFWAFECKRLPFMGFLSTVFISVAYIFVYISDFFFFAMGCFLSLRYMFARPPWGSLAELEGGEGGHLPSLTPPRIF